VRASAHTSLIAVDATTWPRALLNIRPSLAATKGGHVVMQDAHQLERY